MVRLARPVRREDDRGLIVECIPASVIGIVFHYFTIAPMRSLSLGQGIVAAVKASTPSLMAWHVGMYGFMAFASLCLFRHMLWVRLEITPAESWFMTWIAVVCGFATFYPVNGWLIRSGVKATL